MNTVLEIVAAGSTGENGPVSSQSALQLPHDARHIRRKVLPLGDGRRVLIDLTEPTMLHHGDILLLDDGTAVRIEASEEDLFDIRARDPLHLTELAWHIGNRHLAAEIRTDGIRILRDHVIRSMLETLGATVTDVRGPFVPVRGAYSGAAGHHGHAHEQGHEHGHEQHHHHHDH